MNRRRTACSFVGSIAEPVIKRADWRVTRGILRRLSDNWTLAKPMGRVDACVDRSA
jgi:hypothetical protein